MSKKEYICLNCKKVYYYSGNSCARKCPACGSKRATTKIIQKFIKNINKKNITI